MKIAISALASTDNPAPGLGVAKSLLDEHELIGLSYDPNESGNYLGLFEKVYLMPYPTLGIEELIKRVKEIKQKSKIDAIIPNLDAELLLYIKYQKELEALGIKLFLPSQENFELRNKNQLAKLSNDLNIKYPKIFEINSVDDLIKIAKDELTFPFMVKGNYYKAYKVYNLESAIDAFYKISNEWGFPILLQEVVKGEEINLVGLGDGKGNLVGAVAIKKLSTTELGKVWSAITIDNQPLIELAKKFVSKTKWKGPFELECIANNQEIIMIEINPRFPAWVYFATKVGINLPLMMSHLMEGKEVKANLSYPIGKLFIRYVEEDVVDFELFKKLVTKKEL